MRTPVAVPLWSPISEPISPATKPVEAPEPEPIGSEDSRAFFAAVRILHEMIQQARERRSAGG